MVYFTLCHCIDMFLCTVVLITGVIIIYYSYLVVHNFTTIMRNLLHYFDPTTLAVVNLRLNKKKNAHSANVIVMSSLIWWRKVTGYYYGDV